MFTWKYGDNGFITGEDPIRTLINSVVLHKFENKNIEYIILNGVSMN